MSAHECQSRATRIRRKNSKGERNVNSRDRRRIIFLRRTFFFEGRNASARDRVTRQVYIHIYLLCEIPWQTFLDSGRFVGSLARFVGGFENGQLLAIARRLFEFSLVELITTGCITRAYRVESIARTRQGRWRRQVVGAAARRVSRHSRGINRGIRRSVKE